MPAYESEHTKFMRAMMAQHPEWAEDQKAGRALLWDHKMDLGEQKTLREAREANRGYPYDVNFERQ